MKRVITYGTFDLLHYGHINLLRRAKEQGDYLVVALSTDEFNWKEKHKKCYFSYEQRKQLLEAIRYVDLVIPEQNWEQKAKDIKEYHIDTFVMGDDWAGKFDFLRDEGCEVIYFNRTPEISSSQIKHDFREGISECSDMPYPSNQRRQKMRLFIWGTGRLVGKVVGKHIDIECVEGFIDNDTSKKEYMGKRVYSPNEMLEMEYDAICVANLYAGEIYGQCQSIGIDLRKVIFLYNNCAMQDMNRDYGFVETVLGREYAEIVKKRYHVVRGVEADGDLFLGEETGEYYSNDYVRIKSFELAVKEIRKRKIAGAVAEVGVFRGEFAQYINRAFPDSTCYLFDTFEGFDANEALDELKRGNCTNAFVEAYKQTNIGMVLDKMKHLDKIVIKQGFFPESLDGLEDVFIFVSLDVDFENSIYEGLKYFYPRVLEGGFIFVHDYNSDLAGVEKAVDRYESEQRVRLCKMPLCDANGTLVIMK